ncbi:MAG: hypothetical protein HETSPECPRED_007954 [Heterodermia speciosa]|uniref:Rhodopsin domain-containing protein n=1 Tax=Heterodermia speciosa TaxID=116794 RepID=A0A8H3EIV5_9LECA|nr:MAG: hypothetical protein HETSPECPRED_007954 [Heterodermia speciosa]
MTDLSQIPAGRPPAGTLPNFIDPVTLKAPVVALNVVFLALATVFVGLRLYTRKFLSRMLGWDDFVNHGLGKHVWDIRAISLTHDVAHVFDALGPTYGLVIFLVKLSVLLLFFHLFSVHQTMRNLIYLGIGFQAVCSAVKVGYDLAALVQCVDAADLQRSVCVNTWIITIFNGSVNVLTDIYILVLPIVMVLQLQLSPRRRIGVVSIFVVGFLAVIASLARLVLTASQGHSPDAFWNAAQTSICSCAEMNIGIICASMPAMPLFFRQHKLGLGSSFRYRFFPSSRPTPLSSSREKVDGEGQGSKSFKGISLNMTKPTLGFGEGAEEYVELGERVEGGEGKGSARARWEYV